ncbi:MAG: metallophosphoesterase family protein [Anaerolineae bacterium]
MSCCPRRRGEIRIGVLGDTHIPHRLRDLPSEIQGLLQGVDLIFHTGDLVAPSVLDRLSDLAPVTAVRGNIHLSDLARDRDELRRVEHLSLMGHDVILTHGDGTFLKGSWERLRYWVSGDRREVNERIVVMLAEAYPNADCVVFGHSHRAYRRSVGDTLFFNPGAICPTPGEVASVGQLEIREGGIRARLINLDGREIDPPPTSVER